MHFQYLSTRESDVHRGEAGGCHFRGMTNPECKPNKNASIVSLYKGCSNMNASSFTNFVTYMLRQNGIRLYKGLYVTFNLAPDLKKTTVYLSSYSPLNEGHFSILTNSMLLTYQ